VSITMLERRDGRIASAAPPARVFYLAGGPRGTNVYGAERALLELVAGMDGTRFRACCAVTQGEGPYVEALRGLGVPVPELWLGRDGRLTLGSLLETSRCARRLLAVARQARPHLVHVNSLKLNPYGVFVGQALGLPVICHVQAHVSPRAYFTRLAFGAQMIVACSEAVAASWRRRAGARDRLRVVHYGIDPTPFAFSEQDRRAERARLRLSDERFVLGVVSRLSPEKGMETLFQALQLTKRHAGRVLALVAGDSPPHWRAYGAMIRELPAHLGIGQQVMFLGYVDPISSLYAAFDALVVPSHVEGLGRVILEAMAAARPVIATRAGGPAEVVVHGETGLLVPPRDPITLASAIVRLASDPALCRRMGEAGRRRLAEKFTLTSYVQAFEALYTHLLNSRRPPNTLKRGSAPDAL